MREKIGAALVAALLFCGVLTLTGCTAGQEGTPSENQAPVSSSQEQSSQPALEPEPRASEAPDQSMPASSQPTQEPEESALVLTQQDSGVELGSEPTITLKEDGSFTLEAVFYDGSATITGTYVSDGEGYVLTPLESTAQGTEGSDVGEITLTPQDGGFAYGGEQLGVTYDGAVFQPS